MADEEKNKKGSFWLVFIMYVIIGGVLGIVVAAVLEGLTSGSFDIFKDFSNISSLFASPYFFAGLGIGGVFAIVQNFKLLKGHSKGDTKNKDYDKKKQSEKQYFSGKLLSADDVRKKYATTMFTSLPSFVLKGKRDHVGEDYKGAGIPIRAALTANKRNVEVSLAPPIHTMVIGNTGSGKGVSFINPTIQILAQEESKPSMVISDPKVELYRDHSKMLKERGYKVVAFDLSKPFQSDRWNPLDRAYFNYMKMLTLKEKAFVHRSGTPADLKLKFKPGAQFGSVWYEFEGAAYDNEDELKSVMRGTEQALAASVSTDISDISGVIVPESGDAGQKMWTDGCRDLCKAILFAMLEDLKYPETGMTHDKINLYNFYKIINFRDKGDDPFYTIGQYLEGRSSLFQVRELSNTILAANETTKMSYISVLGTSIGFLADPGIAYITSGSDIDFRTFDDAPTALFLITPDDKVTMHKIASMAISQLYKDLTDIAKSHDNLALNHFCFFVLDEFANMPKIEGMSNWITIARSRKIIFLLVLQSYAQLGSKYGEKEAEIIKTNCNIQIFIGSDDEKTLKEFSDKCGTTTVRVDNNSTSESKGKEGKDSSKSKSESFSYQQRPLVFPEELRLMEKGYAYFLLSKTPPFKSVMSKSYECLQVYNIKSAAQEFRPAKFLDTENITYDMNNYIEFKKRSQAPAQRPNPFAQNRSSQDDDDEF